MVFGKYPDLKIEYPEKDRQGLVVGAGQIPSGSLSLPERTMQIEGADDSCIHSWRSIERIICHVDFPIKRLLSITEEC
jgi:hypothetical protein